MRGWLVATTVIAALAAGCSSPHELTFSVALLGPAGAPHRVLVDGVAVQAGDPISAVFESYDQAKREGFLLQTVDVDTGALIDELRVVPHCDCCKRDLGTDDDPTRASEAVRHTDGQLVREPGGFSCWFESGSCSG